MRCLTVLPSDRLTARRAESAVRASGAMPQVFGTITVSDGISMGTEGMKYSLVSREVIADSIETACGAQSMDGVLAIARAARVPLELDDFEAIRARVPVLCDLKPSGRFVATDLHRAGGVPQVMKILLEHGLLHGDALTVTGRTVGETLRDVPSEPRADQEVIRPWS